MSVETGPNIVNSGLVFNLDASNIRSFQGVARTNLARGVNFSSNNTNGTYYKYTQGTEVVDIPQVGKRTVKYVDHWNDYSGGSGNCCPNLFYYHDGWVSVSGSTTYTYSLIYKTTTGYTHPNFMYRYEYVNSSTYVTEGGVHNDNNRTHLGDGWYYAWGQFTTQPTTNTLVLYLFYYQYATWDRIYVDRASLVAGSTVPDIKHITAYNSTNSGNWTDTTGGYTGTLTNGPTYNSDNGGSIVLDGVNDDVRTTLFSNARTNVTMNGWFYVNLGTVGTFLNNGDDPGGYCVGIGSYFGNADNRVTALFGYVRWILPDVYYQYTGWHMITMILDNAGTPSLYINGSLIGTYPGTISNVPSAGTGFSIGSQWGIRYASTRASNVNFYNTALSAAEVQQNFNALRNRFGV